MNETAAWESMRGKALAAGRRSRQPTRERRSRVCQADQRVVLAHASGYESSVDGRKAYITWQGRFHADAARLSETDPFTKRYRKLRKQRERGSDLPGLQIGAALLGRIH